MATYVAVTSTNNDWYEVGQGKNKQAVLDAAEKKIAGAYWNEEKPIDVQTQLVNLTVVSKTKAKRIYGIDIDRKWYQF